MPAFKPYKYTKQDVSEKPDNKNNKTWELRLHIEPLGIDLKKLFSVVLFTSGIFLITSQVFVPWLTTPKAQKPLLKPVSSDVLGVGVEFEFTELRQEPGRQERGVTPEVFYLKIPKLGIERAEVEVNSQNLSPDERLGHYPGSALPGEVGSIFIYGHSATPLFFDPRNYRTIFSTLDKLGEGDEIIVEFGGKYFKYVVEKLIVLNPEDVHPLEPAAPAFLHQSYLTLMTCVPPGIKTQRLLVQARLVL